MAKRALKDSPPQKQKPPAIPVAVTQQTEKNAEAVRSAASAIGWAVFAAGAFWVCAFKMFSNDFWFHLKVGEIIARTHALIHEEPFAYVLEGRPFATHYEYLSQLVFYWVFHYGGPSGFIVFRSLIVAVTGGLLLSIDRRNVWPNVLIVLWALNINRAGFIDRPQLFTFLFYVATLQLTLAYLASNEIGTGVFPARGKILAALAALQIVWGNFHGGATVMGFVPYAALCGERFWRGWNLREKQSAEENREPLFLLAGGLAMLAGSMLTPDTYHSYLFLFKLAGDHSSALIKEWQPRPLGDYIRELGPFWALAIIGFAAARKNGIFCALLLAVMGTASHSLYRLGVLFIFTASAVGIYELRFSDGWNRLLNRFAQRPPLFLAAAVFLVTSETALADRFYVREIRNNGLFGYGVSDYAATAYDFLEKEHVGGRMFDNFDLGAYLIYRGAPERKVFIDGRNADYGETFVRKAMLAANDPVLWQELDAQYGFNYAIVDFLGVDGKDLAFISHLDQNPAWSCVYFDDRVAVYLKNNPENKNTIDHYAYRAILPTRVEFGYGTLFNGLSPEQSARAETELERQIAAGPDVIKGRLVLAMHCVETGRDDRALQLAQDITRIKPSMPEPYEITGMAYAEKNVWRLAADAFDQAIDRTPKERAARLNYGYLARVYANAGETAKAEECQRKAMGGVR